MKSQNQLHTTIKKNVMKIHFTEAAIAIVKKYITIYYTNSNTVYTKPILQESLNSTQNKKLI